MKIALPSNGKMINQHFGKSESFVIITVEDKQIVKVEEISTTEFAHQHQGLADLLVEKGASVVITGGIGAGALSGLEGNGLEVIKGAKGSYLKAVGEYINGTLENKDEICDHHGEHHDHHH